MHYKNKQENSCSRKLPSFTRDTPTTTKRTLEKREWHHRQVESPALRLESLDFASSRQELEINNQGPFLLPKLPGGIVHVLARRANFRLISSRTLHEHYFFLCFFSHVSHDGIIGSGDASLRRRRTTRLLGWGAIAAGLQPFPPPAAAAGGAGVSPMMPFLLLLRAALL